MDVRSDLHFKRLILDVLLCQDQGWSGGGVRVVQVRDVSEQHGGDGGREKGTSADVF